LVTRADAELLVGAWAEDASRRAGADFSPMLEEFEHGFVAWVRQPAGMLAEPGSGVRRVIDRATGEISTWGSVSAPMVAEQYRRHRERYPAGVPTIDPVASIRHQARPSVGPGTAAHLTLAHDRRMRIAYGAKGDQVLNHHPLVRDWLAAHPTGQLARGCDRHAEMIVVSDVLHSYDAVTGGPTSLETARSLFAQVIDYQLVRIRPDSIGPGQHSAYSCYSCMELFVHIGMFRPRILDRHRDEVNNFVYAWERPDFPPGLVPFLAPDGFMAPTRDFSRPATTWDNIRHDPEAPLPQAGLEITRAYCECLHRGSVPGAAHRVEEFLVKPGFFAWCRGLANDFGATLGVQAFPLGEENTMEGFMVGDELGRVFLLDQAGEWFLGSDIDQALLTLYYGREQPRLRDDRSW
jgi:SUKH-3 immunity protein/YwqJ-like deaminase